MTTRCGCWASTKGSGFTAQRPWPGLEDVLERGIVRRGQVLTWTGSAGNADGAPAIFRDLTAWECSDSSFHIEDFVPVNVGTVDDAPVISEADQRALLTYGLSFGLRFARLVYDLGEPSAVRCIISANETNATFRFHQIRKGEHWNLPALDGCKLDKMIVIDISPSASRFPREELMFEIGSGAARPETSRRAQGNERA